MGSRDTSVKVRCSARALCVCRVCCLRSTSPCCWDVLWLQDSLKSPLTFLLSQPRLCTRVAVSLVALMCVGTITQAHANTEGSSCGVSPSFPPVQIHQVTEYVQHPARPEKPNVPSAQCPADTKTQIPRWNGHPLPFSPCVAKQTEIRDATSKGSLVAWCSTCV